jgi:hypothetical protein
LDAEVGILIILKFELFLFIEIILNFLADPNVLAAAPTMVRILRSTVDPLASRFDDELGQVMQLIDSHLDQILNIIFFKVESRGSG